MKKCSIVAAILLGVSNAFASTTISVDSVANITHSYTTNKARFENQYLDKTLKLKLVLFHKKSQIQCNESR